MIESIRKMWKIGELRKKIIYTFLMLLVYRLVGVIPAPGVDALKVFTSTELSNTNNLLGLVNMMTGNNFEKMTVMAMGITPYINASIIMQLLTIAIPALERLSKEEDGRQKINRITRYVTVVLAALQAIGLVRALEVLDRSSWLNYALVGITMAGGTALAMWIGERITEKGIGNGISLLIFVGIISNITNGLYRAFMTGIMNPGLSAWIEVVVIIITCILMTVVVTFVELGERVITMEPLDDMDPTIGSFMADQREVAVASIQDYLFGNVRQGARDLYKRTAKTVMDVYHTADCFITETKDQLIASR